MIITPIATATAKPITVNIIVIIPSTLELLKAPTPESFITDASTLTLLSFVPSTTLESTFTHLAYKVTFEFKVEPKVYF